VVIPPKSKKLPSGSAQGSLRGSMAHTLPTQSIGIRIFWCAHLRMHNGQSNPLIPKTISHHLKFMYADGIDELCSNLSLPVSGIESSKTVNLN
jgi:hypothetical protein